MKNLTNILLLACLTLPFIGSVSWLNYQKKKVKHRIKHEIIAGIDKNELVSLTFTLEEVKIKVNWKHAKEFRYNDNMYDVVEADTCDNIVTYWCWWDSEETKLNKQLKKLLAHFLRTNTQNKETKTQLANFYDSLYYSYCKVWKASINKHQKIQFTLYSNNYESLNIAPSNPPPIYS